MREFSVLCLIYLLVPACRLSAQIPTAQSLIARSIAYHDPDGQWGRLQGEIRIRVTYADGPDRLSRIRLDQPASAFHIRVQRGGPQKEYVLNGSECQLFYDGSASFTPEVAEKEDLNCERARFWRDYYGYLLGMPMKLKDPGTHLEPAVTRKTFKGKDYWVLKATYDPEKGKDTWYFYFDPDTYALAAYQFFHDEAANDGEYILLDGEKRMGSLRLPASMAWYRNAGDTFLGKDIIEGTGPL